MILSPLIELEITEITAERSLPVVFAETFTVTTSSPSLDTSSKVTQDLSDCIVHSVLVTTVNSKLCAAAVTIWLPGVTIKAFSIDGWITLIFLLRTSPLPEDT